MRYVSLQIKGDSLRNTATMISEKLKDLSIPHEGINELHVTLGYILEDASDELIKEDIKSINKPKFQLAGIKVFEGLTTEFDWVAMCISDIPSSDVYYAIELLASNFTVKRFSEKGFSAHISLFKIPKGMNSNERELLSRWLEVAIGGAVCQAVDTEVISVSDENRNLLFKQAA